MQSLSEVWLRYLVKVDLVARQCGWSDVQLAEFVAEQRQEFTSLLDETRPHEGESPDALGVVEVLMPLGLPVGPDDQPELPEVVAV